MEGVTARGEYAGRLESVQRKEETCMDEAKAVKTERISQYLIKAALLAFTAITTFSSLGFLVGWFLAKLGCFLRQARFPALINRRAAF